MISFVKMSQIGFVKYTRLSIGRIDLNDFRLIDIADIVKGGYGVEVHPQEDGTLNFLFSDFCYLTQLTIDKHKNVISPLKTFNNGDHTCRHEIGRFKKQKEDIFTYYRNGGSNHQITKLNLDLSFVKTINVGFYPIYLSVNEDHVYSYSNFINYQVCIYNKDLKFLKRVGQRNNPTGAFYIPSVMKKFESHKGRYYWLSETNVQILREDNGELIRSVAVKANNFIIDSRDHVVLVNNATKEVNLFNEDGNLVDKIPIDNFKDGLKLSLTKDDEFLFYNNTELYLSN